MLPVNVYKEEIHRFDFGENKMIETYWYTQNPEISGFSTDVFIISHHSSLVLEKHRFAHRL